MFLNIHFTVFVFIHLHIYPRFSQQQSHCYSVFIVHWRSLFVVHRSFLFFSLYLSFQSLRLDLGLHEQEMSPLCAVGMVKERGGEMAASKTTNALLPPSRG